MTCKDCIHYDVCDIVDITQNINELKSCGRFKNKADFVEVNHGHWIKRGNEKKCSVCGFIYYSNNDEWNGCPNCLAKMDERSDT